MIDQLKKILPGIEIKENELMKKHTTFKVGGPAQYFCKVKNKIELHQVLVAAHCRNAPWRVPTMPFFIFGGGSNILVSDNGIKGLVIKLCEGDLEIKGNQVKVFSGYNLKKMILATMKAGLTGLEFAANIPGTVGGAVRGNAGAFGKGVGDFVTSVEVLDTSKDEVSLKILSKDQCDFEYRNSLFKKNKNLIIAEVNFQLSESKDDIEQRLKKIDQELQIRIDKQPYDCPSAGCIFKNIEYTDELKKFADWQTHGKIPAGKFIEQAGLKGKTIGGAKVSEKHANFIVNTGNAQAEDIFKLINLVKKQVKDKFGIELEEEVHFVGF